MLEAYRAHHATEAFHVRSLRRLPIDSNNVALRAMLSEFGLLRNLNGPKGVASVRAALKAADAMQFTSNDPQKFLAESLKLISRIETSLGPKRKDGIQHKRGFSSGATKVAWFAFGHKFPMLDRYTMTALNPLRVRPSKLSEGPKDLRLFFDKLNALGYAELFSVVNSYLSRFQNFTPSPERTIDKILLFRGMHGQTSEPSPFFRNTADIDTYAQTVGIMDMFQSNNFAPFEQKLLPYLNQLGITDTK